MKTILLNLTAKIWSEVDRIPEPQKTAQIEYSYEAP